MTNLPSLDQLLRLIQQVPYMATKNIYKVAGYFLEAEPAKIEQFIQALQDLKRNVLQCQSCFAWHERIKVCPYCDPARRDSTVLCVVATWQDLLALERTQGFTGVYHVLGGLICPLEGVTPRDLKITQLLQRLTNGNILELVLALSQTPEGEATAAYIVPQVQQLPLKVSCLARGVPVGSAIEYMDRVTLYKALSERRPF
ncbi:MAG TPA: recombination mediator RecR [Candidatus Babeliales bacterium]|nr:recombination mediator RecR [Candidatus Babeliales bacterium]